MMIGESTEYLIEKLTSEIPESSIETLQDKAKEVYEKINTSVEAFVHGLILGKIQSGKTNNILMTNAVLADNGVNSFIILTSDDNWLYKQTCDRVVESLPGIRLITKNEFDNDNLDFGKEIQTNDKIIIVCTKNAVQLSKLSGIIDKSGIKDIKTIIFDDEADQGSLDTNKSSDSDEKSSINSLIKEVIGRYDNCAYIQVTATPQALLLQEAGSIFKPSFVVLTEQGPEYVGGDNLFSIPYYGNNHLKIFSEADVELEAGEDIEELKIPKAMKYAIITFLISATAKKILKQGNNFASIFHLSLKKGDHQYIASLISVYIDKIKMWLSDNSHLTEEAKSEIQNIFNECYEDISNTVNDMPSSEEICKKMKFFIPSRSIQTINSDSFDKEPSFNALYNIVIGGAKLSRGVTIKNLITTYYARQTGSPKMDTIQQHARMYGYRKKDIDVIRIFITKKLADRFAFINESENDMREEIKAHGEKDGLNVIIKTNTELKATRSNVLNSDDIIAYRSGKRYFPKLVKFEKMKNEGKIDILNNKLKGLEKESKDKPYETTIDELIDILQNVISEGGSGFWNDKRISYILKFLKGKYGNKAYIIVRRDRNLKRDDSRGIGGGSMLSPNDRSLVDDSTGDYKDCPVLYMYEISGEKKGWDGYPFWVPNFRFPDGNNIYLFNITEEE